MIPSQRTAPGLTAAQLAALAAAAVVLAVAFGLDVATGERSSLVALATVLPAVLIAADAAIRLAGAQAVGGRDAPPAYGPPVAPVGTSPEMPEAPGRLDRPAEVDGGELGDTEPERGPAATISTRWVAVRRVVDDAA